MTTLMNPSRLVALVLFAAGAAACQRNPTDSDAEALVRRYNALVTEAYRAGDYRIAQPVIGADEFKRLAAHVGVRLDQGITLDARLLEMDLKKVERHGDEAVVTTDERWHYFDRRIGSGEQVGQESRDHYVMRYHLKKADGRWIVESTEFAQKPEVGRPEVPSGADPRSLHGFETVNPAVTPGEAK
jgi:hypothetical protein